MADLRVVARRVLDYLSKEARAEAGDGPFKRALNKALDYALTAKERAGVDQSVEPAQWPNIDTIIDRLIGKYALLLDLRIPGKPSDHLVWDIVDVRGTYGNDNLEPDCEHVAIAVLALEEVIPKVASANWDGLVEKAVASITHGNQDIVAIMVRADDIPGANGRTRLSQVSWLRGSCQARRGAVPRVHRGKRSANHGLAERPEVCADEKSTRGDERNVSHADDRAVGATPT